MTRRTKKPEDEQSIPEMVDGLSREEARRMYKGGKLTAHGGRWRRFWTAC